MIITSINDARHLEGRLGIGCHRPRIDKMLDQSLTEWLTENVDSPLDYPLSKPKLRELSPALRVFGETAVKDRQPLNKMRRKEGKHLLMWWLKLLQHSDFPVLERMTLFWHGHFTSSFRKVGWAQLMYRQNQLFRVHALGSFSDLLHAVYKDPAMLIYLDGRRSTAQAPNENFARELLELFTLGVGHYAESDIINAARAFTGWRYQMKHEKVVFVKKYHDHGVKTFLGHTGRFDAKDIINIILEHPRTAEFIAEKFWQHFVSTEKPPQEVVREWGATFRDSNYQIMALLSTVLHSDVFWQKEHRGGLIKSPVEFSVGLLRELQLVQFKDYQGLMRVMTQLGQHLFNPPDVKGWSDGLHWINHTTLTHRLSFVEKAIDEFTEMQQMMSLSISQLSPASLQQRLLPLSPTVDVNHSRSFEEQLRSVLTDPVYQLR